MSAIVAGLLLAATPFQRGSEALVTGQWQAAVDAFTEAIEAEPTAKAYINRGIAYRRLGKPNAALADFNAAIRLEPREPVGYLNRGRLHEKAGQPEKAIADFTTALKLKPSATAHALRGTVHQKAKDYAKARADYLAALKRNANELTALNNLAWLQATCPDADFRDGASAVQHATRVCRLTNWRVHGYVSTLAAAYAEAGDFEKAVTLAGQIEDEHLASYRAGKPVRDE